MTISSLWSLLLQSLAQANGRKAKIIPFILLSFLVYRLTFAGFLIRFASLPIITRAYFHENGISILTFLQAILQRWEQHCPGGKLSNPSSKVNGCPQPEGSCPNQIFGKSWQMSARTSDFIHHKRHDTAIQKLFNLFCIVRHFYKSRHLSKTIKCDTFTQVDWGYLGCSSFTETIRLT